MHHTPTKSLADPVSTSARCETVGPIARAAGLRGLGRVVAAVGLALLAACGGGGSSGADTADTADTAEATVTLRGSVIDGPIEGAVVFLDLNGNLEHDTDEPVSARTDGAGAFSLETEALSAAQWRVAQLVSHVPDTARDADDAGRTLAQAGRPAFTLAAPAEAAVSLSGDAATPVPVVLSPFSTLVVGEVAVNGLTLAESRAAVQAAWGLEHDPLDNFVARGDAGMRALARGIADGLGLAMADARLDADREGGESSPAEWVRSGFAAVRKGGPDALRSSAPEEAARDGERPATPQALGARAAPGFARYIVVFRSDVGDPAGEAAALMRGRGGQITQSYAHALRGFAVTLPSAAADAFLEAMARHPLVDYVEADQTVTLNQTVQGNAAWGLDRSDQRGLPLSGSYSYGRNGQGVRAYVVDSGILSTHSDFGGRVSGGYSAVNDGKGTRDCHGHGTHVAGTVGGSQWGIAKGVTLVPVRVLDCNGSGPLSAVIAGLDWIVGHGSKPAVVNLSLGAGASSTLDAAVAEAVSRGYTVVAAAGNSNANACNYSPAREPSAITVGATTSSDARASFSNFGTCLDLFAPGSGIRSASHASTTGYATMSGTSMAAPHVAGLAALALAAQPGLTPSGVASAIKSAATTNKVTSAGSGSANRLIYTQLGSSTSSTTSSARSVSVASLSGSAARLISGWQATVTIVVKDSAGAFVPGVTVSGSFTQGGSAVSCKTASNGVCSVKTGTLSNYWTASTTYTVKGMTGTGISYNAAADKTRSITVYRP